VCWQHGSRDFTNVNVSRRMIAATVLRELRLLDAINIAARKTSGESSPMNNAGSEEAA
jgi:hypothetical protein